MSHTLDRTFSVGAGAVSQCPSPSGDDQYIDSARGRVRSRWHDLDDDDPYDPPLDDDEDYEDFAWEEVPDDGQAFPPDELWDNDGTEDLMEFRL